VNTTGTATPASASIEVTSAVRATYAAFIGSGFAFATWASRIPQVRDRLQLSPAALGLVLLAIAAGSLIALPLAGIIVHRFDSRRTVTVMAALGAAALILIAAGYRIGVIPVLIGLFVFGFANGAWDVAMNVQGANAERQLGRAIMPRFHAGYSIGTVGGALLGAAMVALHVPVTVHLIAVAVGQAVIIPIQVRAFLPDHNAETQGEPGAGPLQASASASATNALARWREPRTLLIGVCVLAFALAEGAGNDWINVSLIDAYHSPAVLGTLGFATFLTAMTAMRWIGTALLDRYGRVAVVRTMAGLSVSGIALFAFSPSTPLAFGGAFLWGCGAALGFPVGMSAAADDPAAAAGRVSVVASIGYVAFLGGPPLIGLLGSQVTVHHAVLVVAVLLLLATVLAGSLRPAGAPVEIADTPSPDHIYDI
jgi:predicted MFS family arabinose efflux permease